MYGWWICAFNLPHLSLFLFIALPLACNFRPKRAQLRSLTCWATTRLQWLTPATFSLFGARAALTGHVLREVVSAVVLEHLRSSLSGSWVFMCFRWRQIRLETVCEHTVICQFLQPSWHADFVACRKKKSLKVRANSQDAADRHGFGLLENFGKARCEKKNTLE